jgi:hypothetical protein
MDPARGGDSYDSILYLHVQNVSSVAKGLYQEELIAAVMAWRHAGSLAFQ